MREDRPCRSGRTRPNGRRKALTDSPAQPFRVGDAEDVVRGRLRSAAHCDAGRGTFNRTTDQVEKVRDVLGALRYTTR